MAVRILLAKCVVLLITLITLFSYVSTTVAESTFGPADPENNDFIFESEDVTLACRVTEVNINEAIVFNITYEESSTFIVTNSMDTSDGKISSFDVMNNEIRFVIPSVEIKDSGLLTCFSSSAMLGIQRITYFLRVSASSTVECKQNSTLARLSLDTLKLSCYYTASNSMNFAWYQTNGVGESSMLTSTLVDVNDIKRHLISYVQPSDDLTGFTYSCQSSVDDRPDSLQPSHGCNAGFFVVYSQPIVAIKPDVNTISLGETRTLKCAALNITGISVQPIWVPRQMIENVSILASGSLINISVSNTARDGTLISVQCEAFLSGKTITYTFTIIVGEPSATTNQPPDVNSTDLGGMQDNQNDASQLIPVSFIIIISCAAVALVVAVLLSVVLCWCLSKGKQREGDGTHTQNPIPVYGKIMRKSKTKDDGTPDRSIDDFDYETQRAYDNNEMGSLPIRLSTVNDLNGSGPYDDVNRSHRSDDDAAMNDDNDDDGGGKNDDGDIGRISGQLQYEDYY